MKNYLKENELTGQVRELTAIGISSEAAIEYVYDAHTMSKEEFAARYLV